MRYIELEVHYDDDTDALVNVTWQWRNSQCRKNGVSPTVTEALFAANKAYEEWRSQQ